MFYMFYNILLPLLSIQSVTNSLLTHSNASPPTQPIAVRPTHTQLLGGLQFRPLFQ